MSSIYDASGPYDSGYAYDAGYQPAPPPPPPPVPGPPSPPSGGGLTGVTYLFTDLNGKLNAEMPCTSVSWTQMLNNAGTWQGTLNVEDPVVAANDWVKFTDPNLTMVWVDVNGVLVWGGVIDQQNYTMSQQTVQIHATDPIGYLADRIQAADYSTQWATVPFAAANIAYQMITDALSAANSLPVDVGLYGSTPNNYWVTFAAPKSQQQSIGSLISQMQSLGYMVGFDLACDYQYVDGVPLCTISLAYPRRGRVAGTTGLLLDLADALEVVWPKDGTQQAMKVVEMATSTGGVSQSGVWEAAMSVDGYPLLEKMVSHASFSGVSEPQPVLDAYVADDLALSAYPVITPVVTIDTLSDPVIGSYRLGDDFRVISAPRSGPLPPACPRFPNGLDVYLRLIQTSTTIKEEGVSTTAFTLAMPPTTTPQRPPT